MSEPPASSGAKPPVPRWVKVFGVAAALVVLLFLVLLVTGGHRPRRHDAQAAPAPSLAVMFATRVDAADGNWQ